MLGTEALAFLAALGCVPSAQWVVDPSLPIPGMFRDGVITVRSASDQAILVHEAWHSCQWQRRGGAGDSRTWFDREAEARRIELLYRSRDK